MTCRLIIHNKPIEAIELSKIPREIWGRVALSEIISHTDFGWDDVVQQPPISRSYLGYWAYRIYIYIYIYIYTHIYIYIFIYIYGLPFSLGTMITGETLFSHFFISHSQHCSKICVPCGWWNQLSIFEHIFYSNTTIILSSETGWSDAHTLLNAD